MYHKHRSLPNSLHLSSRMVFALWFRWIKFMTIDPFQNQEDIPFFWWTFWEKGQPPFPKMYPDTKLLRLKAFGLCPRAQQMLQGLRNNSKTSSSCTRHNSHRIWRCNFPWENNGKQQELEKKGIESIWLSQWLTFNLLFYGTSAE